jgi:hypothetical protein
LRKKYRCQVVDEVDEAGDANRVKRRRREPIVEDAERSESRKGKKSSDGARSVSRWISSGYQQLRAKFVDRNDEVKEAAEKEDVIIVADQHPLPTINPQINASVHSAPSSHSSQYFVEPMQDQYQLIEESKHDEICNTNKHEELK